MKKPWFRPGFLFVISTRTVIVGAVAVVGKIVLEDKIVQADKAASVAAQEQVVVVVAAEVRERERDSNRRLVAGLGSVASAHLDLVS